MFFFCEVGDRSSAYRGESMVSGCRRVEEGMEEV